MFGTVKLTDVRDVNYVRYCDLGLHVIVVDDLFLKLIPESFLRRADDAKQHFDIRLDIHQTKEEMLASGWNYFESVEAIEAAIAERQGQSPAFPAGILFRSVYLYKFPGDK